MKQFLQRILIELGANDTQSSCVIRASAPNLVFLRNKIKLHPIAVGIGNDTLGAKNDAVFFGAAQFLQYLLQLLCRILMSRLRAPACKYLVCVVMAFVIMMVMIMTATGAVLVMLMVVFMAAFLTVMVMAMPAFFAMVMMTVLTFLAVVVMAVLTFFIMVMMTMLTFLAMVMVVMPTFPVMVVMAMLTFPIVVMAVMLLHLQLCVVHGCQNLLSVQFVPRCCDHCSMSIVITKKGRALLQLFICHTLGSAYHDSPCMLHLVIEEFTEILHIHLAFLSIHYNDGTVNVNIRGSCHIFHSLYHIGKLTHTGGLNQNPIRPIGIQNLLQSRTKVSY